MISIKRLSSKDIETAMELFTFFQADDGISHPIIMPKKRLKALLNDSKFHVLVAFINSELAGGLTSFQLNMYKSNQVKMLIYEIGVKSKFRRNGIGKKLIEEFKIFSKELRDNKILVLTTKDNFGAIGFYQATGVKLEQDCLNFNYDLYQE